MVRRLMDLGLERLGNLIEDMAVLSEKCVSNAIDAYLMDKNVVEEIYAQSNQLFMLQDEVSDLATEVLVRYQPVATDLRFIRACMDIAYGFGRFGRYAYDIAQVRAQLGKLSNCDNSIIASTAEEVKKMIRESIKAFNNRDVNMAKELLKSDDLVDSSYRQNLKRILDNPIDIRCAISSVLTMRYLERIADHAVYIGELAIYIVSGERIHK